MLQIRRGYCREFKDKFSYFSTKAYLVIPHQNHLGKAVVMKGHKRLFFFFFGGGGGGAGGGGEKH